MLTNATGGAVVVRSTGERDGKRLNDRQVHLFHLENARVVEIWQFVGDGQPGSVLGRSVTSVHG